MEEKREKKCEEGLPPWLATFADMMALLMCFFVLLLSFAEIDAIKFKKMAESFKDAFGVQREILASEIVKGISIIAQEFTGATPELVITETIKQETTNELQEDLQVDEAMVEAVQEKIEDEVQQQAEMLEEALREEIEQGLVVVETLDLKVIVRIQEKGSFPSGSAQLHPGFLEVMDRISSAIAAMPGGIVVAGHTDNVPIHTERFRSNWELSSARAVTVVHALLENPAVDPDRVLIEGHGDTQPLVPNDSRENRALNRRVELIIERADSVVPGETPALAEPSAEEVPDGAGQEAPAAVPETTSPEDAALENARPGDGRPVIDLDALIPKEAGGSENEQPER
jgi:chemotaxis protein MotB